MNKVVLIGRLVADVELNNYGKGKNAGVYTDFTIAISNGKDKDATFIPCKAFNGSAELLESYVGKGDMVCINGRISIDAYTDKDGNNRKYTYVTVEGIELLPNSRDNKKK